MRITELDKSLVNGSLSSLKNCIINTRGAEHYNNLDHLVKENSHDLWMCYFKIALAQNGFNKTKDILHEIEKKLDRVTLVSIGNFISKTTGNYTEQLAFLNIFDSFSHAWIEREKIRTMTIIGKLDEATLRVYKLIEHQPSIYNKFAVEFFWLTNLWKEMNNLSCKLNLHAEKIISTYALDALQNTANEKVKVRSIFNSHTRKQYLVQREIFARSNIELLGSEGVAVDLLPNMAVAQLGASNSLGILGAALAHLKAIENFYTSGDEFSIITESDSYIYRPILRNQCQHILGKYDFVLCADKHTKHSIETPNLNLCEDYIFEGRASGFYGYILNRKAAKLILEHFNAIALNKHIDGEIIKWVYNNNNLKIGFMATPIFGMSYSSSFSTRAKVELGY